MVAGVENYSNWKIKLCLERKNHETYFIVASVISVLSVFRRTVGQISKFLAENHLHPKWNHPSKFQLIRVRRFGGVREQTNKQTNKQTHSLTDRLVLL